MAELFVSLRNLEESRKSYILSPRSEQNVIQGEIRKNNLQDWKATLRQVNERSDASLLTEAVKVKDILGQQLLSYHQCDVQSDFQREIY
ncbi:unnamed protein product, partial [Timema podura]|nr:unnamed protein product [Timema podura]